MLHPTRQREGFAGRTSPGAAFAAAGTLVLHGPRSSAVAVVWESECFRSVFSRYHGHRERRVSRSTNLLNEKVGYAVVVDACFY